MENKNNLLDELKNMIIKIRDENNLKDTDEINRRYIKEEKLQKILSKYKNIFKSYINDEELKNNKRLLAIDFSNRYSLIFKITVSDYYKDGARLDSVYIFELKNRKIFTSIYNMLSILNKV